MRIPTIFLAGVLLVSGLLLFAAPPAAAADGPREAFDKELTRIDLVVSTALARVKRALAAKDWNAWCPLHDAYVCALNRGVVDTETAITRFLFCVMEGGGTFDDDSLGAVDDAAWMAGDYAHRRVLISSWAMLVKRGVPPDRRGAALDLLARQGVYDGESVRNDGGPVSSCDPGPSASPVSGRIPGSTEAAQALSKWQFASMRAESALRSIRTHEAELQTAEVGSRQRTMIEKRLAESQAEYKELVKSTEEWRRKYFQAGGR